MLAKDIKVVKENVPLIWFLLRLTPWVALRSENLNGTIETLMDRLETLKVMTLIRYTVEFLGDEDSDLGARKCGWESWDELRQCADRIADAAADRRIGKREDQ